MRERRANTLKTANDYSEEIMKEGYVCIDYNFNESTFSGRFLMPEGFVPEKIYLKNNEQDKKYTNVGIERYDGNVYEINVDFGDEGITAGTWFPVAEDAGGNQHFFVYKDMVNNADTGKLIELSLDKLYVNPETKNHYMGSIDKNSLFAVRKWRNKSAGVRRKAVYAESAHADGMTITFNLKQSKIKPAKEAELWLWSKPLKKIYRICLDKKAVNKGCFSVDLAGFADEYRDIKEKQWEIYLVCNRKGTYYQSRITLVNEKKYKNGIAVPGYDDSDRYIVNTMQSDTAFQIFFDDLLQLCQRTVVRRNMYRGIYRGRIESFYMKNECLYIRILCGRQEFTDRKLILRHKSEVDENGMPLEYECETVCTKKTRHGDAVTFSIDCRKVDWIPLRYELYITAEKDGYEYEFRLVGKDRRFYNKLSRMYKNCYVTDNNIIVYLMETIGGKMACECRKVSEYDSRKYRFNEWAAVMIYRLFGIFFKIKKNFLFYEKFCTAAQDNSYYMFEYFMERNEKKYRPLYVIEKKRPVYSALKEKYNRNILEFMSIRHLIYLQAADAFVSTDSKRHCYRWNSANTKILQMITGKKFVFLQHGVIGFKRVDNIYGKQYANRCDLFVASSPSEKEIISRQFGYDDNEIIVTGLARWDKLVSEPVSPPMIFYMPTWRNWIKEANEEDFVKTDYYKAYSEILNSEKLAQILEKNNVNMVFCLHPKFRDYMHCIEVKSPNITTVGYDEGIAVNKLLMKCSMFITDYSSASWDVLYMDKPVLFYQFDYDMYMDRQGSYINMEKSIFGCRVTDFESFTDKLSEIIESGFKYESDNKKAADDYFPVRDTNHRKRIYDCISKMFE